MRILGVDPGLRITGYGVIEAGPPRATLIEAGVITPDRRRSFERRLWDLQRGLSEVIAANAPDCMVVEEVWTSHAHPKAAEVLSHVRGVLLAAAAEHGLAVRPLVHSLVKRALVGSGAARKAQVKRMVMEQLALATTPEPDDVSDALALALAFANIEEQARRFARIGITATR